MYALRGLQLAVRRLTINLGNIKETKPPGPKIVMDAYCVSPRIRYPVACDPIGSWQRLCRCRSNGCRLFVHVMDANSEEFRYGTYCSKKRVSRIRY